ncbi:hypothetical protein GSY71_13535 [Pusillimonas sp. TS35]|nr:hypothetical protein [Pusillimonas sp. TS35]
MQPRQFLWTAAHTLVSLAFGGLLLFLALRFVIPADGLMKAGDTPATWTGILIVLSLGNPFFRLLRYRNLIAVCFFTLLIVLDPATGLLAGTLFSILVLIRKLLYRLQQQMRDRAMVGRSIGTASSRLSDRKNPLWPATGLRGGFAAGIEGACLKPEPQRADRILHDDAPRGIEEHSRPSNNDAYAFKPFFNPANGYPMFTEFTDFAGNPYGCDVNEL